MDTVNKTVLVHSCHVQPAVIPRDLVVSGDLYVGEMGVHISRQEYYSPLPKSCRCKRRVSSAEATQFVSYGWAVWILQFRRRKGEVVLNDEVEKKIMMPVVRSRVPRVDLISRADIERAYIGSEKKTRHFVFNPIKQKFVRVQVVPEGMTKREWMMEAEEEVKFERRIRKQYQQYIDDCHQVTLDARFALMVPFIPDPFEGRTIFSFSPEMRTAGGHV